MMEVKEQKKTPKNKPEMETLIANLRVVTALYVEAVGDLTRFAGRSGVNGVDVQAPSQESCTAVPEEPADQAKPGDGENLSYDCYEEAVRSGQWLDLAKAAPMVGISYAGIYGMYERDLRWDVYSALHPRARRPALNFACFDTRNTYKRVLVSKKSLVNQISRG